MMYLVHKIKKTFLHLGFNKACLMGRVKVVSILLDSIKNVEEIIQIKDGSEKTGFMHACEFGKVEVIELLLRKYHKSIATEHLYKGFKLACSHTGKKVIPLLLHNGRLRYHVLQNETKYITRCESGMVLILKPYTWRNENRELQISFNDGRIILEPRVVSRFIDMLPINKEDEKNMPENATDRNGWLVPLERTRIAGSTVPLLNFRTGEHILTIPKANSTQGRRKVQKSTGAITNKPVNNKKRFSLLQNEKRFSMSRLLQEKFSDRSHST